MPSIKIADIQSTREENSFAPGSTPLTSPSKAVFQLSAVTFGQWLPMVTADVPPCEETVACVHVIHIYKKNCRFLFKAHLLICWWVKPKKCSVQLLWPLTFDHQNTIGSSLKGQVNIWAKFNRHLHLQGQNHALWGGHDLDLWPLICSCWSPSECGFTFTHFHFLVSSFFLPKLIKTIS